MFLHFLFFFIYLLIFSFIHLFKRYKRAEGTPALEVSRCTHLVSLAPDCKPAPILAEHTVWEIQRNVEASCGCPKYANDVYMNIHNPNPNHRILNIN